MPGPGSVQPWPQNTVVIYCTVCFGLVINAVGSWAVGEEFGPDTAPSCTPCSGVSHPCRRHSGAVSWCSVAPHGGCCWRLWSSSLLAVLRLPPTWLADLPSDAMWGSAPGLGSLGHVPSMGVPFAAVWCSWPGRDSSTVQLGLTSRASNISKYRTLWVTPFASGGMPRL